MSNIFYFQSKFNNNILVIDAIYAFCCKTVRLSPVFKILSEEQVFCFIIIIACDVCFDQLFSYLLLQFK
jgi:hypothetical protein